MERWNKESKFTHLVDGELGWGSQHCSPRACLLQQRYSSQRVVPGTAVAVSLENLVEMQTLRLYFRNSVGGTQQAVI